MKFTLSLLAALPAVQALTTCDSNSLVSDNGNSVLCGYARTNCANYGPRAFCGIVMDTIGGASTPVATCCIDDDSTASDAAKAVYDLDTCTSCLANNNDPAIGYVWDVNAKICFDTDNRGYFPNPLGTVGPSYGSAADYIVNEAANCPVNCHRLEFYGTCWKRCGSRGWGVDPANYPRYGGYGYGGYYGGYGYGGYGYGGYGYGGYGYGGYGYGGYGYGGYGYGGYGYGGYGYGAPSDAAAFGYPYGTVPSVTGRICADPAKLDLITSGVQVPPPPPPPFGGYYGGYGYGGYYGGGYGGYYGVPVYGRQYVGTIYGGTSTIYAGYAGSAVYGGGIYGAPVYGGVYGGGAAASVEEDRCSPTIQCSCDTECCARGDCCADMEMEGCEYNPRGTVNTTTAPLPPPVVMG
jgi:hypothetical protein